MSTLVDPVTGEQFEYRLRGDWGAQSATQRYALANSNQGIKDHWIAGAPPPTIAQVDAMARSIQHNHIHTQGWFDYAYNHSYGTTADGKGYIVEGRGFGIANGAQGGGHECHAISWYGGYPYPPGGGPDDAGYRARLCIERVIEAQGFNVTPNTGHRQETATACPGDEIMHWLSHGKPIKGAPPTPPPAPKPHPGGGMDDELKYWRPDQTRNLYSTDPMMGLPDGDFDVAEFQYTGNLTTNGQEWWTDVDGKYGDDTERLCRLVQTWGLFSGLYSGKVDGIAGKGTRHVVVATLNAKGIW